MNKSVNSPSRSQFSLKKLIKLAAMPTDVNQTIEQSAAFTCLIRWVSRWETSFWLLLCSYKMLRAREKVCRLVQVNQWLIADSHRCTTTAPRVESLCKLSHQWTFCMSRPEKIFKTSNFNCRLNLMLKSMSQSKLPWLSKNKSKSSFVLKWTHHFCKTLNQTLLNITKLRMCLKC